MGRAIPASSIFVTTSWRCRWKSFGHPIPSRRRCTVSNIRRAIPEGTTEIGHPTMTDTLVEDYLRWLAPQIRDGESQGQDYWDLLSIMFEKPFQAFVPNDDNRMVDGTDLRAEFCYSHHIRRGSLNNLGPASFLEVLIGLSRRL